MQALFFPASILLGGLWALARQDQTAAAAPVPAHLEQKTVTHADRVRLLHSKDGASFFKPSERARVLHTLRGACLEQVQHGGEGFLYRAVAPVQGAPSAASVITAAESKGLATFASVSAAVPNSGEILILIAHGKDRAIVAGPTSVFAVLGLPAAKSAAPSAPAPEAPAAVRGLSRFDAHLPKEAEKEVTAVLEDPNASLNAIRSIASVLQDEYPLAAKALSDRITALELSRKLAGLRTASPQTSAPAPKAKKANGIAAHAAPTHPISETPPETIES